LEHFILKIKNIISNPSIMKNMLMLISCLLLLNGCARTLQVNKKRYSYGYYVSLSGKRPVHHRNNPPVKKMEVSVPGADIKMKQKPLSVITADSDNRLDHNKINRNTRKYTAKDLASTVKSLQAVLNIKGTTGHPVGKRITAAKENKRDFNFIILTGLFASASFFFFRKLVNRTKKIAYWARSNPSKAKISLACIQTLLITGGIYGGRELYHHDIISTAASTHIMLAATAATAFFSPVKKIINKGLQRSYKKQSMHYFAVAMLSLLLFVNIGNRAAGDKHFLPPVLQSHFDTKDNLNDPASGYHSDLPDQKDKRAGKMVLKVALTVTVAILSLLMIGIIAGLACELECMGEMGLAVLVCLGGLALTACTIILALDAIWRIGFFKKEKVKDIPVS
jgi:hypothetical protein